MTIMPDLTADTFTDRELSDTSKWYTRVFQYINQLRAVADPMELLWSATANTTNTAFTTGSLLQYNLDTVLIDTLGIGLSSDSFIVPVTGIYYVCGQGSFAANAAGTRRVAFIAQNGAQTEVGNSFDQTPSGDTFGIPTGGGLLSLTAGDDISLYGTQDSGSTINAWGVGQVGRPALSVMRIA